MKQPTRRFFVTAIEAHCSIGIYEHERQNKQRVIIDVEVVLDPALEPRSDAIMDELDYAMISDGVLDLATARHYDLQETLARRILDHIMTMRHVVGVTVTTSKPDVYPDCKSVSYRISAGDTA